MHCIVHRRIWKSTWHQSRFDPFDWQIGSLASEQANGQHFVPNEFCHDRHQLLRQFPSLPLPQVSHYIILHYIVCATCIFIEFITLSNHLEIHKKCKEIQVNVSRCLIKTWHVLTDGPTISYESVKSVVKQANHLFPSSLKYPLFLLVHLFYSDQFLSEFRLLFGCAISDPRRTRTSVEDSRKYEKNAKKNKRSTAGVGP